MKVNMNQMPEKEPESNKSKFGMKPPKVPKASKRPVKEKKVKPKKQEAQNEDKFDYGAAIREYTDKWGVQLKKGDIFRQNRFWIIVAIILFIIFLSINSNANNAKTYYTVQIRNITNDTQNLRYAIDDLKADLEEQARIDAAKLTEKQEEEAKNDAKEQGSQVAYLQNQYPKFNLADYDQDEQAYKMYSDMLKDNKTALLACFDDDSRMGGQVWYPYYDGIPGTWEFASRTRFSGDSAKVLWLCYADEDRMLLAYCTAKYNVSTKLFSDVKINMTKYANTYAVPVESTDTDNNMGNANSIVDDIGPKSKVESIAESIVSDVENGKIDTSDVTTEFTDEDIEINNQNSIAYEELKKAAAEEGTEYDPKYNPGPTNMSDEAAEMLEKYYNKSSTDSNNNADMSPKSNEMSPKTNN